MFSTIARPFKITRAKKRASTFSHKKEKWCGEGHSDPTAPWTHQSIGISLQVIWIGCADGRGLIVLVTEPLETIAVEVVDGVFHGWFQAILDAC